MSINQYRIEAFFDEEGLRYFRAGEDAESGSWFLMFGNKTGVNVRLLEDGECLLVRSQPLVHLDEFDREGQCRVWEAMAHRNDQIVVGRYSGVEAVVVEAALPIEDHSVSDDQLKRLLGVVVNESNHYGPQLRKIAHDPEASVLEDPIDDLMRQLFASDEEDGNDDGDKSVEEPLNELPAIEDLKDKDHDESESPKSQSPDPDVKSDEK